MGILCQKKVSNPRITFLKTIVVQFSKTMKHFSIFQLNILGVKPTTLVLLNFNTLISVISSHSRQLSLLKKLLNLLFAVWPALNSCQTKLAPN